MLDQLIGRLGRASVFGLLFGLLMFVCWGEPAPVFVAGMLALAVWLGWCLRQLALAYARAEDDITAVVDADPPAVSPATAVEPAPVDHWAAWRAECADIAPCFAALDIRRPGAHRRRRGGAR